MDHSGHNDHGQAHGRHDGHKMSDINRSYDRHAGHSVTMFRGKFWLSFALTIPVILLSADVQHWLGYTTPSFPVGSGRDFRSEGRQAVACELLQDACCPVRNGKLCGA